MTTAKEALNLKNRISLEIPFPHFLDPGESLTWQAIRALLRHHSGLVGLAMTLLLALLALFSPLLTPYDPLHMDAIARFQPPSATHLLGTDEFGRDILSRILLGARLSFTVAFVSTGLAAGIGVLTGAVAGYVGGKFDTVSMRLMDALLAFPAILLAIVILAVLGPGVVPSAQMVPLLSRSLGKEVPSKFGTARPGLSG